MRIVSHPLHHRQLYDKLIQYVYQRKEGKMPIVNSQRLQLVSMQLELLEALRDGDAKKAETIAQFQIPVDLFLRKSALTRRIDQLREQPSLLPWFMRAIVVRESGLMCGRIGFHSKPGPDDLADVAPEGVELGYEIDSHFRRRGYAKEAAIALMKWAFDRHKQKIFVLSISPTNTASLAIASSLGFQQHGSHDDVEDGLELYFVRRIDWWPKEWE